MVEDDIVSNSNAYTCPSKAEWYTQPLPQHRSNDCQEDISMLHHEIVEANAETRPNYAHSNPDHCSTSNVNLTQNHLQTIAGLIMLK